MSRSPAKGFIALFGILSLAGFSSRCRPLTHKDYLGGDEIRLIDHLSDDNVNSSPLRTRLKTIQKEEVSRGWKKLGILDNGVSLWQSYSSRFIATSSFPGSDHFLQLYRDAKTLRYQADLFQTETQAERWSCQSNQVCISLAPGGDPNKGKYTLDYQTFDGMAPTRIKAERLTNPMTCAWVYEGSAATRLIAYPLQFPLWRGAEKKSRLEVLCGRDLKELPFREDLSDQLIIPSDKKITLYPQASLSPVPPLPFFRSSDTFVRILHVSPGPYIIEVVAKASLAGPEPAVATITLAGREVARLSITSEEWQVYHVHAQIPEGEAKFCLGFANDYFDPQTLRDRNIFVSEIRLWPTLGFSPAERSDFNRGGWTWLDDSEEILYQAAPGGVRESLFQPWWGTKAAPTQRAVQGRS